MSSPATNDPVEFIHWVKQRLERARRFGVHPTLGGANDHTSAMVDVEGEAEAFLIRAGVLKDTDRQKGPSTDELIARLKKNVDATVKRLGSKRNE